MSLEPEKMNRCVAVALFTGDLKEFPYGSGELKARPAKKYPEKSTITSMQGKLCGAGGES